DFPIVAGSAFWADAALRGSDGDIERAWSAKAQAYAQHLAQQAGSTGLRTGDLGTNDLGTDDLGTEDKEQRARTLLACSGLPALFVALARLTPESHIGRVLTRVSQSFRDLARVGEHAARHELAVLAGEEWSEGSEATAEELQTIEGKVKDTLAALRKRGKELL